MTPNFYRCSKIHFNPAYARSSPSTSSLPLSTSRQDTWSDPPSLLLPPIPSHWITALSAVDRGANVSDKRNSSTIPGLPFPDPLQVVRVENRDRFARYLANWLIIRPLWVRAVDSCRVPFPSSKHWREILNGLPQFIEASDHSDPAYASYRQIGWLLPPRFDQEAVLSKNSEKARALRQAALDFLGESKKQFQVLQHQVPEELHFHSSSWRTEAFRDVEDGDVAAILWELSELSFRYELLLVDRTLMQSVRADLAIAEQRDLTISLIFDTSSLDAVVDGPLPEDAIGLASSNAAVRRGRLIHLVSLMLLWPSAPVVLTHDVPDETDSSYGGYEHQVLVFYLQTLYYVFDRRPSVPRLRLTRVP